MATFKERLNQALAENNMKPIRLAELTGIDRGTISNYLSGKYRAAQGNLFAIAEALDVNEAWLMGHDVSKERMSESDRIKKSETVPVQLPFPEAVLTVSIYPELSCGTGLFVEDQIIGSVSVPLSMLPNKSAEYFAQYASGDSMTGAGIQDGDLIVFKKTNVIENGQIGCFCIDENVATCKKFSQIGGSVYLLPANDKYQPIPVEPENQCFRVIGLLVAQMSKR